MGGPSLLFAMGQYLFQRGFVSGGYLVPCKTKNLCVSESCPRARGRKYFIGRLSYAGQDVLQEAVREGYLSVYQGE